MTVLGIKGAMLDEKLHDYDCVPCGGNNFDYDIKTDLTLKELKALGIKID